MIASRVGSARYWLGWLPLVLLLVSVGDAHAGGVNVQRDIVYARPGGVELRLDAYLPDSPGPHPAVLVIHGGSWQRGSKRQLAPHAWTMAKAGLAAFAISYRFAPEHRWPAQIDDCKRALLFVHAHAKEFQIDPQRIGAFGYSAGGHLAALLGMVGATDDAEAKTPEVKLQVVVAGGAPVDFQNLRPNSRGYTFLFGDIPARLPGVYRDASPIAQIPASPPPVLFFHGTTDAIVSMKPVQRMIELLQANGGQADLLRVRGMGHYGAALWPGTLKESIAFLKEHLSSPSKKTAAF